jgi:methionyl-tRNA synthetase
VIPFPAEAMALALGEPFPPTWPTADAAAELTRIEPGREAATPPVLFKKVEDAEIADWSVRFGGTP